MADVTVTVEHDSLTVAFDRLGAEAHAILMAIAKETADELKAEVQARLRRQTSGTGRTANAITVEKQDTGYRVTSGEMGDRPANLPIWLEFGTKHMTPKASWEAARLLLSGTYIRRVEDGMQRAIDGLGGL